MIGHIKKMFTNTTPCKISHASCLVISNRTSGNTFRHPNVTALHCQKYTVGVYPENIRELMRTSTRPFQSGEHGEQCSKTFQNVVDHPSTKLDISCKDASLSSALCSVSCIVHAWIRHLYATCASLVFFCRWKKHHADEGTAQLATGGPSGFSSHLFLKILETLVSQKAFPRPNLCCNTCCPKPVSLHIPHCCSYSCSSGNWGHGKQQQEPSRIPAKQGSLYANYAQILRLPAWKTNVEAFFVMKQVEVPESIYSQDGHILVHIMHQMYVDIDTPRYYQYNINKWNACRY